MRKSLLIALAAVSIPVAASAQYGAYAAADEDLNQTYHALMGSLSPAGQQTLRDSERAWIEQRNRVCGYEAQNGCAIQWVRARTADLRGRLAHSASGGGGSSSGGYGRTVHGERVGQCFSAAVAQLGSRLEGDPTSGSAARYSDGHVQVSYDVERAVRLWRRGDPVRICVVSLPQNCPRGDDRGIVYRATNQRTRTSWTAPDSQHGCGGA